MSSVKALIACVTCLIAFPPSARGEDARSVVIGGNFPVVRIPDIGYVEGDNADPKKHKLDLYLPKDQKNVPVLFFIHGGGWSSGDRWQYGAVGRTFAKNGIAVVVLSYRLTPQVQHPGHIQDVARAFAWTYRNIAAHGGNPNQIFVTGQSAGGHLAALLATNPKYLAAEKLTPKAIKGVMPISGIYTFPPGRMERIIGKAPDAAHDASPSAFVSGNEPPFLILYADNDFPGCDAMSLDLEKRLKDKHVNAVSKVIPERNHITIMFRLMINEADTASQELLRFIAEHSELKLTPREETPKS